MTYFLIYLFVMVEKLGTFLAFGWLLFWIGASLLLICVILSGAKADCDYCEQRGFKWFWENDGFVNIAKRPIKPLIICGFILGTLGHFTPTQKDLAIIIGSGVTYEALTSETGKRVGGKAIELLEHRIDEALKQQEPQENKPSQERAKTT